MFIEKSSLQLLKWPINFLTMVAAAILDHTEYPWQPDSAMFAIGAKDSLFPVPHIRSAQFLVTNYDDYCEKGSLLS